MIERSGAFRVDRLARSLRDFQRHLGESADTLPGKPLRRGDCQFATALTRPDHE